MFHRMRFTVFRIEDAGPDIERLGRDPQPLRELLEDLRGRLAKATFDLAQVGVRDAGLVGQLTKGQLGAAALFLEERAEGLERGHAPILLAAASKCKLCAREPGHVARWSVSRPSRSGPHPVGRIRRDTLASVAKPEILVDIVRSGFVEGHHRGSVVALGMDGGVAWSIGDVTSPIYPRSCNKPVQAVGMLRLGLELDGELLALCAASHSGEPFHLDGVRRMLARSGLDETALQTPPDYPLDNQARVDYIRAGHDPAPIAMNCSGKHAGMLATCQVNGWPLDTYLAPDHPVQLALADTFAELTGGSITSTGVDGCGAPLFSA